MQAFFSVFYRCDTVSCIFIQFQSVCICICGSRYIRCIDFHKICVHFTIYIIVIRAVNCIPCKRHTVCAYICRCVCRSRQFLLFLYTFTKTGNCISFTFCSLKRNTVFFRICIRRNCNYVIAGIFYRYVTAFNSFTLNNTFTAVFRLNFNRCCFSFLPFNANLKVSSC